VEALPGLSALGDCAICCLKNSHNIIVFNRENHMVFHPLLAEVASAAVQPKDVGAPLRQLLHHVQCRTEDILNIDLDNSLVEYEAHDGKRRQMNYDQVVIACGNAPNLALVPVWMSTLLV
jgi:NADH dehydrogenase